ncbi:hypothetical protein FRC20_002971 [Serendipita sp. 405]|nr:hypothetical protein FRC20_002971 [Serendipita sp. 405]
MGRGTDIDACRAARLARVLVDTNDSVGTLATVFPADHSSLAGEHVVEGLDRSAPARGLDPGSLDPGLVVSERATSDLIQ